MPSVLIIPDIHQHLAIADRMLERGGAEEVDRIVLLGDLFDDFYDTPADTANAARWLLAKRDRYGEKLVPLIGNHDLPYLESCQAAKEYGYLPHGFLPFNGCPGYAKEKAAALLKATGPDFAELWRLHHREQGVLYTHAGANARQANDLEKVTPALLANLRRHHPLFEAGRRIGLSGEPGILWRDFSEFRGAPGLPQIFGHTPHRRRARIIEGSVCLDSFYTLFAVMHDDTLEIQSVDGESFEVAECRCATKVFFDSPNTPKINEIHTTKKWRMRLR